MERLITWGILMGIAVVLAPLLYWLGATVTASLLIRFQLSQWNPANWIGALVGIFCVAIALFGIAKTTEAFLSRRSLSWRGLITAFTASMFPAAHVAGVGIAVFVASIVFIPAITLQLAFLLSIFTALLLGFVLIRSNTIPWNKVIRGAKLQQPRPTAEQLLSEKGQRSLPWGALVIEKKDEPLHFGIIGNIGTGKSTLLEMMMTPTLTEIGVVPNVRGLVFDSKRDIVPFLEALGAPYKILNPLDERCTAWRIGHEIEGDAMASELAAVLIPDEEDGNNNNRYFNDAGRIVLTAAIISLQHAKVGNWTLRDLILAVSNKEDLADLIHKHHPQPSAYDEFFKSKKQGQNEVLTTIQSRLQQFNSIAARWENAKETFTFKDWIKDEYILVLGSDHLYQDTIKKTNTLLFRFVVACLNNLSSDEPDRRVWIFIDEASTGARFDRLENIVGLGRSAGICVVIAFHSVAEFIKEYGESRFKLIFGTCRHKAILGLDSDSAKIISEYIGEYEYVEQGYNESTSYGKEVSSSNGTNYKRATRRTVMPQELMDMNLPQPGPKNGLTAYFIASDKGIHRHTYSWQEIQERRVERIQDFSAYLRVSETDPSLTLKPWSEEERKALGLPVQRESSSTHTPPTRPKPKKK
ncbi:type IV secretion system DNA-binding domain-containing protein [Oculatella sp. FACHB-28]|uniref:type IV secretion system DNA-binding domain-containing protein n=1 Tax=Oculatella sp. FACHB-28 TaxID=2692845 RepID=UPI0016892183|nr:type IV secretion system DNA-binding domain-containing protein [Oculatella sp. FACHB-28]MBD2060307.1 type IV secretion system DNA-binding domain-containing protein [Oculatella sp. FACHB-28]